MKVLFYSLPLLALLAFSFAPELARAQDDSGDQDVSFQTFYDQLSDQGTWIQTDNYGYVFQPNVSDPNWAPYTDGHWVSTDVGWTWVTDEPWGWATYHYGRWANIDGTGWVWVPGYRWAPAWVSWRYGGGYCGWAPLPPETLVGADYDSGDQGDAGFHFGNDVDVSFHIGAGCYNFLPVGDMGEPNYRGRFADRGNNYAIINNTKNDTNIYVNYGQGNGAGNFRGVTTGGPSLKTVNAHSHQHIATVQLTPAGQPGPGTLQGHSLAVFAPRVKPATGPQARPAAVAQTISQPTFNRGDTITKPLDVTTRIKAPAPTPEAIESAQRAQASAPPTAKIATGNTPMKTTLSRPLTSMAPLAPERPSAPPGASPIRPGGVNPEGVQPPAPYHAPLAPPNAVAPPPAETFHPLPLPPQPVRPPSQTEEDTHPQPPIVRPPPNVVLPPPAETFHPLPAPPQPVRPQPQPEEETRPQPPPERPAPTETEPQESFHPQPQQAPRPQPQPELAPRPQMPTEQHAPVQKPANKSSSNGH